MGCVLSVDRNFPLDEVGSSVFGLSKFQSNRTSSEVVLLGRIELKSQLLDFSNSDDSFVVKDLSVAFPPHSLRLGLLVFGLPFSDVSSLGLNLGLEEVSVVSSGGLLSFLGELSGALLVVLDDSLADFLLGLQLEQLDLEVDFLLAG